MAPFSRRKRRQGDLVPLPTDPIPLGTEPGDEVDSDLSPLVQRLREMEWPDAPEDARERCLQEILGRVREDPA